MLESCSVGIVMSFDKMKMFWRLVYIWVYLTLPKGTIKMDKVVNSIIDILLQLELKSIRQTWWCIPVIPILWEDQELKVNLDYECLKTTTKLRLCDSLHGVNLCNPMGNVAH